MFVCCFFFGRVSASWFLGWPGSVVLKDLRDSRSKSDAGVPAIDEAGKWAGLDDSARAEAESAACQTDRAFLFNWKRTSADRQRTKIGFWIEDHMGRNSSV